MQPQGLEALMQQSQPMPQMDNPRLAAAMDVVTSDAEEQILDPRTLAMLKYKDALQAMQAADQMMASAQPAPTAPTVAERTKLAAEQGIAGLARRLSPGVQQQGSQMAAQQAQQAMQGGGLPQLPAPNMAGMAGGGIVGYVPGGAVNPAPTPTKVVPRPIPMGQPNVASQAAASDDVARYIYNYTNLRSSMEAATDPQQKAEIAQILREMQQTYSPDIVAEAHMKMSQQNGMAGGGVIGFQAGGPPNVGSREAAAARVAKERAAEQLATAQEELAQLKIMASRVPEQGRQAVDRRISQLSQRVSELGGGVDENAFMGPVDIAAALNQTISQPPAAAQEAAPSTGTVNLSRLDKLFPKREAPSAPAAKPMDGIAGILQAMQAQATAPITAGVASERANERQAQVDALNEQRMNPNYAETTRTAEEARYRAATDPSMEELKALIRSRSDALDKPMFTPEEERSRKISALLQGLASSNLIAQSGPAASRGIAAVSDAVREDSMARAEKQFDLASSLISADMEASKDAFAAGLSATTQAMADQSVALNAVSSQLIAEGNREAAALIAQSQNQMKVFEAQLKDAADLRKILSDESIAGTQAGAAARRDLINLQGNLYSGVEEINRTIAELSGPLASEASAGAVTVLNNQKDALLRGADAISQRFGISVDSAAGVDTAGTGQLSNMSNEDLLNMLGQ
jgi:hypothetical protein